MILFLKKLYNKYLRLEAVQQAKIILGNQYLNAIDVGAAGGLIPHWQVLLGFTKFHLFEPYKENYEKLVTKYKNSKYAELFKIYNIGLSKEGGQKVLYVLNAPTGSSLLPIDMNSEYVYPDNSYIFPIKEVEINTQSLEQVLAESETDIIDLVKLDVQGSELDILKGLGNKRLQELLVAEIEVGFSSIYLGAPTVPQMMEFFKEKEFILFDLNLASPVTHYKGNYNFLLKLLGSDFKNNRMHYRIHECDMLFVKNPQLVLQRKDHVSIGKLITILCVYGFHAEALKILLEAKELGIPEFQNSDKYVKAISTWNRKFIKPNLAMQGILKIKDLTEYFMTPKPWKVI